MTSKGCCGATRYIAEAYLEPLVFMTYSFLLVVLAWRIPRAQGFTESAMSPDRGKESPIPGLVSFYLPSSLCRVSAYSVGWKCCGVPKSFLYHSRKTSQDVKLKPREQSQASRSKGCIKREKENKHPKCRPRRRATTPKNKEISDYI